MRWVEAKSHLMKFAGNDAAVSYRADRTGICRVLHVGKYYPPHMGGIEVHLRDLAEGSTRACSVDVLVANSGLFTVRERSAGVDVLRLGRLGTVWSMPICPSLPDHLRRAQADLVHLHMPNPAAAFAYVVSGCRIPLVMTHHSDTVGRAKIRWLSDPFVRESMRRAVKIIVTSKRYADTSAELAGFLHKVEVIPLGVEVSRFDRGRTEASACIREQYGPPLIVGVGRLVPFKGFEVLIRAMQHVEANLLLIGDGPLRYRLERVAREIGVEKRVYFRGNVDNSRVGDYLLSADVFAMPSITRAESFGIVQLEAMAAGLPVVNTSLDSGVPEVSLHGITGLTVPPGQPEALGRALKMILSDPEMRGRMGEASRGRVRTEFTAELMIARTLSLYSKILDSN